MQDEITRLESIGYGYSHPISKMRGQSPQTRAGMYIIDLMDNIYQFLVNVNTPVKKNHTEKCYFIFFMRNIHTQNRIGILSVEKSGNAGGVVAAWNS